MTELRYQVKTDGGLTKPYSLKRLRAFRDEGKISNELTCTADGGKGWHLVGDVLSQADSTHRASPENDSTDEDSEGGEHHAMRSEIVALNGKLTAEQMFSRRGRNSPTGRSDIHTSPSNGSGVAVLPELESHSNSSQAALVALKRAKIRRAAEENEVLLGGNEQTKPGDRNAGLFPVLVGSLTGAITGSLITTLLLLQFLGDADGRSAFELQPVERLVSNPAMPTLTNRELTAELKVLSAQLGYVANRSQTDLSGMPIPESFDVLTRPPADLLPYTPNARSPQAEQEAQMVIRQFAELVRAEGPDGRKLDPATVDRYTKRFTTIMSMPGSAESTRTEAARDLAEKCKLLYLLQLGNLRSPDPDRRSKGIHSILAAADSGLKTVFAEFVTGDTSLDEILAASTPPERTELILIRYWCYRAANRVASSHWLKRMSIAHTDLNMSYIEQTISEVDAIE